MVGEASIKPHAEIVSPIKMAHVVFKTSRFREMVDWYKTVLGAHSSFENEELCFLRFDEEHHRIAILNIPSLQQASAASAGLHHVAFTYGDLRSLLSNWRRLTAEGIEPKLCINHGPTTSMYYADPDGNQVELQVDNFETEEEGHAFFVSDAFRENPIGVDFDPAELLARLDAGDSEQALKVRPRIGPRDLSQVNLH